jgi:hypothetical protein
MTFKALLATKDGDKISTDLVELEEKDLMPGNVTVAVEYSTVELQGWSGNYRSRADHPNISANPGHRSFRHGPSLLLLGHRGGG